jgi:hypothetical protein
MSLRNTRHSVLGREQLSWAGEIMSPASIINAEIWWVDIEK